MSACTCTSILARATRIACATALVGLAACGGSPPEADGPVPPAASTVLSATAPSRMARDVVPPAPVHERVAAAVPAVASAPAPAQVAAPTDCAFEHDALVPPPDESDAVDDVPDAPVDEPAELPAPTPQS